MVQVGCTNNYDRRALWKPTEEIGGSASVQTEALPNQPGGLGLQRRSWFVQTLMFCRDAHVRTAASAVPPGRARRILGNRRALTIPAMWAKMIQHFPSIPNSRPRLFRRAIVGLWRSWERASMAWKRSSVRSRPGPPNLPALRLSLLGCGKNPLHAQPLV